jgi:hypothetical protein
MVVKDHSQKTVIVRRDYHDYAPKYLRYERRHSHIAAHKPPCIDAKVGEKVKIMDEEKKMAYIFNIPRYKYRLFVTILIKYFTALILLNLSVIIFASKFPGCKEAIKMLE